MDDNKENNHTDLMRVLNRIEDKLDNYSSKTIENKQDIIWIKGYIKLGLSAIISLAATIVGGLIHIFTQK